MREGAEIVPFSPRKYDIFQFKWQRLHGTKSILSSNVEEFMNVLEVWKEFLNFDVQNETIFLLYFYLNEVIRSECKYFENEVIFRSKVRPYVFFFPPNRRWDPFIFGYLPRSLHWWICCHSTNEWWILFFFHSIVALCLLESKKPRIELNDCYRKSYFESILFFPKWAMVPRWTMEIFRDYAKN